MVQRAVLMKSGLVSLNTARQVNVAHSKTTVNAARSMTYLSKTTHLTVKRPIQKNTTFKNSNINQRVNTVRCKNVNIARPKAVVNAIKGNHVNVVKASAYWVWKPKTKGNPQMDLQDQGVIDSGCSRHMTGNMPYLTDYKEIDRGYVAFGGNPKGGKITGKVPLKQIIDESQVLLRVPRKNNMYSVDLKNIVPKGGTKDETSCILKSFITRIENLVDHKVKVIRCDNGTEFKKREMNQFCEIKGIMRQFSIARTPQQNGVAERRNMTLIEADRTILADSKLSTTFWAEAVNTASYVQNNVSVVKPHNKTPYELFHGRIPTLSFMRPFGCLVTILNTKDHLSNFDGKADEGFVVRYSLNTKALRVFNSRTRIVEENLHIRFSENSPNDVSSGLDWLFDIDVLTRTMNYEQIVTGSQSNGFAGIKASDNAGQARKETEHDDGLKPSSDDGKKDDEDPSKENECYDQEKEDNVNSTNNVNPVSLTVNVVVELPFDPDMPSLEDVGTFDFSNEDEDDDVVADMNNLDTTIQEELLQFKLQEVWTLVDLPNGKKAIGTKWVFRNKKDERKIMIRKKARLLAQGNTQEKEIAYDEVFAPIARIKAIRLFLAYASFKDFVVYQMDVKSTFLNGNIKEEVVIYLEKTKTTQANELDMLKRRVKKLERRNKSKTHKLKRLYKIGLTAKVESSDNKESLGEDASKQGMRIDDINVDEEITLVNVQANAEMFDVDKDLGGEEVFVEQEVLADKEKIDEVTLAQALAELKTLKPKTKGEKGKGIIVEEHVKPKKKDQIRLDEEAALKLQAEFDKEEQRLKRRKFFAAKRAKKKRNKPSTQAQKRKIMCTYLKNMEGYKLNQLKSFEFDKIQEMFDRAFKRVNTFEPIRSELVKGKEKRAGEEIEQERLKKQKIYKEGKKRYYQIIRADGKSKMYMFFSQMLTSFDREDLEDLYKLVKDKYGSTRPVEDLDLLLWGDLKTMFEPHIEDTIWRKQQGYKVLEWKLYDSFGVHSLRMQSM
uniref:Integrase catalytic domain-containing protein n=1 Tax=Tanacetum cinerariifolium TaxID=118510 RepID=A0A6L2P569_TANCI|nr:hypothetical protein [Tanacetum cinerariifolium]